MDMVQWSFGVPCCPNHVDVDVDINVVHAVLMTTFASGHNSPDPLTFVLRLTVATYVKWELVDT